MFYWLQCRELSLASTIYFISTCAVELKACGVRLSCWVSRVYGTSTEDLAHIMITPFVRQLLVVGSTQLAALSAGGMIAYPSVLLQQLKSNNTSIQLDLHSGSWIGSVHGIAGLPSILMPILMQCKGRKLAFILSCIFITIGWTLICIAKNIRTLLIGECFHGLGGNSLLVISFMSISEMIRPKYRSTCMQLYVSVQAFGLSAIGIMGQFLDWRTVGLIMCCPILMAIPIACTWPESPLWLAWKGKMKECRQNFIRLRGTDEESQKELKVLIDTQKVLDMKPPKLQLLRDLRRTITSRDFYIPALHKLVLLNVLYWGGGMPVIIYSTDMMIKSSGKQNLQIKLIMDIMFFIGYCATSIFVRYFNIKKVMLLSMFGSTIFMTLASAVTYLQSVGKIPKDSELAVYCLAGFVIVMCLGSISLGFCLSSEIMPVKHRGIGGGLFVICTCVFHSSSLKAYPYLSLYINIWGVFLLYAAYTMASIIFIWRYVPETRNRTLQEIEDYYCDGHFKETVKDDSVGVKPQV